MNFMGTLKTAEIASTKAQYGNKDDPRIAEAVRILDRQQDIRRGRFWTPPGWQNAAVQLRANGGQAETVYVTLLMYPETTVTTTHGPTQPIRFRSIAQTINYYVKNVATLFYNSKSRDYTSIRLSRVSVPFDLLAALKRDALEYDLSAWYAAVELLEDLGIEI